MNTDLIIIGAGPGGYRAAEYAAKQGLQVVIIEQDEVGGTCLNRGCIPTKTYVHAASFDEARERMGQVVPLLRSGVEGILAHPNITLMRGTASFLDSQTVNVSGDTVVAKNIIIATGSSAKLLPLPDINDPRLVTSTELLQCPTLPKRLAIIGAGVIGMEFASVFHRFGSEVTVIEYLKECLPMVDSDIAKRLRKLLEKRGIKFQMKTAVQSLADIDADMILMATGRKANTEGLNLSAAGITPAPNGTIPTNDNFSCVGCDSVAATLYAIGDVNGKQMLAHAAEMQAIRAVNHILGKTDGIRFDIMPATLCRPAGAHHWLSCLWRPCCRHRTGSQRTDVQGHHSLRTPRHDTHPPHPQRNPKGGSGIKQAVGGAIKACYSSIRAPYSSIRVC